MTIETKDTGRVVTRLGTDWPVYHELRQCDWGWLVTDSLCGGDASMATRRSFKTEWRARRAFEAL